MGFSERVSRAGLSYTSPGWSRGMGPGLLERGEHTLRSWQVSQAQFLKTSVCAMESQPHLHATGR